MYATEIVQVNACTHSVGTKLAVQMKINESACVFYGELIKWDGKNE